MDVTNLDWQSMSLAVLFAVGATNVVSMWKKDMTSKEKWLVSVVAALVASFVPVELGNEVLTRLKDAVGVAVVASGSYKIVSRVGGQ